jgi:hypothetical protein
LKKNHLHRSMKQSPAAGTATREGNSPPSP